MYEDAEIERAAFIDKQRVFCIASAGTTALRLADRHDVVACDINPVQLAYARRRAAGGPVEKGDAERMMGVARTFMPLVGWTRGVVRRFLTLSDVRDQIVFWKRHLDTWRFRAGLDLLMSPAILGVRYSRPLLSVLPARFGRVLRTRLERTFARHPNASNPHARALLTGEVADGPRLPPTRPIELVANDAAACLESFPARHFDAFTLSNILDGATPAYRSRLLAAVEHAAAGEAVVVIRSFAEPPPGLADNRAEHDRSLLWGVVDVRPARELASAYDPERPLS